MSKPDFAYVIYINASREEVWRGLLEPEFTRQYWFHENISDWEEGSDCEHRASGGQKMVDIVGKVLESDPHVKLVLTWSRPGDKDVPPSRRGWHFSRGTSRASRGQHFSRAGLVFLSTRPLGMN